MELTAFWSNEARIRAILGGASDTFIGLDLQGRVAAINGGAEKMFAIPVSELLGCVAAESRLPEALRTRLAESLGRLKADEAFPPDRFEFEFSRAEGPTLHLEGELYVVGAGKEALLVARLLDATQRWRTERKNLRLGRILRTLGEGNQALVRADNEHDLFEVMCRVIIEFGGYRMAFVGMVDHDEAKTIRPVAHAGREAGYLAAIRLSWEENDPFGRGPSGMSIRTGVPQVNNDFVNNAVMSPWRAAAAERGYLSSLSLPLKDGARVFGALVIYAGETYAFGPEELALLVQLADNLAYGVVALRTRRERDEIQKSLCRAQKMEALGQLTGGIAHDFNNHLQVILSNLDLGLRVLDGGGQASPFLRNAMNGARQGAKLTSQLLAIARRQPLRPEPSRLDRMVGEMMDLLRRCLGERVTIELVAAAGLWTALIDPDQLQNALLNLAINARDAMPDGGKLTIKLKNRILDEAYAAAHRDVTAGEYVQLTVRDRGVGMAPEILDRVYEPFFTTKPEGVGTGLGLAMVYGFIRQSGGHIRIESRPGEGTAIKLYLPRSLVDETTRAVEAPVIERGRGETILVVEDEADVRNSVTALLAELGYRVLVAANGEEASQILAAGGTVDLLFTDMVMPGAWNGRSLADEARKIIPNLPVLYTSGYSENMIMRDGRLLEGVVLLSKPYRESQLAQTIRSVLSASARPPMGSTVEPAQRQSGGSPQDAELRPSLLIVEDDEMVRFLMVSLCEEAGYQVREVAKPSQALSVLAGGAPIDVLVTDFILPEMNGIELIRKALVEKPDLAVILASGASFSFDELPDERITVLAKPFRPEDFQDAIRKSLAPNRRS